ncbi:MAG: sigma-70 family RNA polymerase sigma factor [Nocardioidaceae bacterium]|nr:sigma-70 family RNA polymerase sigma factor [Nocardioidaceae bacterium]
MEKAHTAARPAEREEALHDAVVLNMEVARSLAAPYGGRGISGEDLEQVAYAALVRAARDFDPDQADEFLSYAVPTVRGEVKKYFRDCGWTVRPPRRIQELQATASAARARLEQATGREPDLAQIAEEIGEDLAAVEEAMGAEGCFTPTSLDRPLAEDSSAVLGELLPDPDNGFEAADARLMLAPALQHLGTRDRTIVKLRFYDGLTQKEIGDRIGVTQMQVSRLISRILRQLREDMVGPPTAPAA